MDLSRSQIASPGIKDERWVIKTFRPLLRSLDVQNIPPPPDYTVVFLADSRNLAMRGMGRCIVIIEQRRLPGKAGGMLITSHNTDLDYFKLHILINSGLCNKTDLPSRSLQKIAAVHEFTHTVAALSAISRIGSRELIRRLKEILRKKTHAIYYDDIKQVAAELKNSTLAKKNNSGKSSKKTRFPDEHFRLGFEDFPVSYPVIFEEFLLSKELFREYFPRDVVDAMCKAVYEHDNETFVKLSTDYVKKIIDEKALDMNFVISRIEDILVSHYVEYFFKKK
jgi:hypothetical protein